MLCDCVWICNPTTHTVKEVYYARKADIASVGHFVYREKCKKRERERQEAERALERFPPQSVIEDFERVEYIHPTNICNLVEGLFDSSDSDSESEDEILIDELPPLLSTTTDDTEIIDIDWLMDSFKIPQKSALLCSF